MANEKELKLAKEVYETLCNMLDARKWKYAKDDEKMAINFGVADEKVQISFAIYCDADRQLIRLMSLLPFKMSKEKLIDGAIATSYINYCIADGSFDYSLADGSICFRMTSSFRQSLIGENLFKYMIDVASMTIYRYIPKLLMIEKGELSIDEFIVSK